MRHDRLPHFLQLWHHHHELELVLVIRGEGTRFIGDSMDPFGPGDLVLLGDYLPHRWLNSPEYFDGRGLIAEGIIIHFERSFLANALYDIVEFDSLLNLVKASDRGIVFKGSSRSEAPARIYKILDTVPGITRMIYLLDLLRILAEEKEFEFITSPGYIDSIYEKDVKLRKVNDYVMNNFQSAISLRDVADEVCMNEAAFCRYFKKATNTTFFTYLTEIRIGYACKLLQANNNDTIAGICYESGFNNLSNFNQKFKQYTGYTPSTYIEMSK
ncbi:AraC family transcriptional regulator [Cerina litoralis]|uniref:AraC family transcriptional regulator n=1 Tax=Cerina litoralis TaxID=2874477 RepID=UPI00295B3A1A|nr:helix-turn-helix domain-containing protein [Cerina litoralis]